MCDCLQREGERCLITGVINYIKILMCNSVSQRFDLTKNCVNDWCWPMVYSNDLRWRIIHLRFAENKRELAVARLLQVSVFPVRRVVGRFPRYGHVGPARIGRPDIRSLLTTRAQLLVLMDYIFSNSTAYLRDY